MLSTVWRKLRAFLELFQKEKGLSVFYLVLASLVVAACLFAIFERPVPGNEAKGITKGLWWAIATITNTGYGDVVPKTTAGRILGGLLMVVGILLFAVLAASITSILVQRALREEKGLGTTEFANHVIVCGWSRHVPCILQALAHVGEPSRRVALVCDVPEEEMTEFLAVGSLEVSLVRGDFTHEATLRRAGVERATCVLVVAETNMLHPGARPDERTIIAVHAIKSVNPKVRVVAEALDPESVAHLRRAEADDVVVTGEIGGLALAKGALAVGLAPAIAEMLDVDSEHHMARAEIPRSLRGKTFLEVVHHFKEHQGKLVVGLVTEGKGVTLDEMLGEGSSYIDDFIRRQFERADMSRYLRGGRMEPQVRLNPPAHYVVGEGDVALVLE